LAEQLGRDSAAAILLPRSEMTEATGSKEKLNQDYENMSVKALRQYVGGIPGVPRRIRCGDGKWRESTKDELIAAIRASSSDAGERSVGSGLISSSDAAERPQPLAGSEASAGLSFCSSGDRSGAKNAGVPQDNTAGPLEKTTDESNTFEMWKATNGLENACITCGRVVSEACIREIQNKHGAHQRVASLGHSKTVLSSEGSVPSGQRIHRFVVEKCAGGRGTAAEKSLGIASQSQA
jgi:hypothetical protein